ncbi:hypothetical protein KFL_005490055 [Klebsormidium nitens]|uniref:Uncharacterized protein n=1 Tax=Klebsormidium nitens TaxID=105231 RepID=A0A1Y1ILM8_KLENI|nr:hypothetical protein KFL_005490055 [Klebsormidium nitens]|eukprot:GAQ89676.1 hypothetical protein KFL_005490055 [Klebsormidium nitens]
MLQVVDPKYDFNTAEIGRHLYPKQKATIARELLEVLGFPHPLAHGHVTGTLAELRETLATTIYFREYTENVKLFHERARGNQDVLAKQKSATTALNHVFSELGLQLEAMQNGREPRTAEGRRGSRMYGGWKLLRAPKERTRPVVGPVGVDLMAQLLKLRVEDSAVLKSRIQGPLREYVDGVPFRWPTMHANASEICGKSFASKQALEGHRGRKGCTPAKLPSDRAYSKYHGLEPGAAHALKRQSNTAAVSKYRHTLDGKRAVFRARHISKLRSMVIDAVPAPPMPKAPNFVRPPISWLIADAQLLPFEVPELFESGKTGLSHKTWSLKYHPDKVEVCIHDFTSL